MKMLLRGGESLERIRLLLKMTGIRSPEIKAAIESHLHLGMREQHAAIKHQVEQQNLNRALKKLNDLTTDYEELKALDWQHLQKITSKK